MTAKTTRTFRLTAIAKRANVEFAKGMGVGVLSTVDVTFTLPPSYSDVMLELSIEDQKKALINDVVECIVQEVIQSKENAT